jgi:hypothetical protein
MQRYLSTEGKSCIPIRPKMTKKKTMIDTIEVRALTALIRHRKMSFMSGFSDSTNHGRSLNPAGQEDDELRDISKVPEVHSPAFGQYQHHRLEGVDHCAE